MPQIAQSSFEISTVPHPYIRILQHIHSYSTCYLMVYNLIICHRMLNLALKSAKFRIGAVARCAAAARSPSVSSV